MEKTRTGEQYRGIGIGRGMAFGKLMFYGDAASALTDAQDNDGENEGYEAESAKLRHALSEAKGQLQGLAEETKSRIGAKEAEIFEIHEMLLEDGDLLEAMERELSRGSTARAAVRVATETFAGRFAAMDDEYMSARAADIRDVGQRVEKLLCAGKAEAVPAEGEEAKEPSVILVARDLTPSQTVGMDLSRVAGFVTMEGTPTSHTSILARAMGLPALVGAGEISAKLDGSPAVLDAAECLLTVNPASEVLEAMQVRYEREKERTARLWEERMLPATAGSGHTVRVYANIGNVRELKQAFENGAEGVGLFRSEFLFLESTQAPDEERQFRAYREMAEAAGGRQVIIRTLDAGADKQIAYLNMPKEENPALGVRAIRLCLAHPTLFRTQLRAILRASAYGKLALMLPMVVSAGEVRQARNMLAEEMQKLREDGIAFDEHIGFGIMIETPAAALMSDELAPLCDFFSVGTNDLLQYTLAADRQNGALETLRRDNTEPVLRLIEIAAAHIHRAGGWIGICGELAADEGLTQRFCDMRLDELSVVAEELLELRARIRQCF